MIFNDRPYHRNSVLITSSRHPKNDEALRYLMNTLMDLFHGSGNLALQTYDAIVLEKRDHESGDTIYIAWGCYLMPMED